MRARPHFEDEELKRFEERMKNIEWDNEKGKGVLSDEAIEKIAQSVVKDVNKKDKIATPSFSSFVD